MKELVGNWWQSDPAGFQQWLETQHGPVLDQAVKQFFKILGDKSPGNHRALETAARRKSALEIGPHKSCSETMSMPMKQVIRIKLNKVEDTK